MCLLLLVFSSKSIPLSFWLSTSHLQFLTVFWFWLLDFGFGFWLQSSGFYLLDSDVHLQNVSFKPNSWVQHPAAGFQFLAICVWLPASSFQAFGIWHLASGAWLPVVDFWPLSTLSFQLLVPTWL